MGIGSVNIRRRELGGAAVCGRIFLIVLEASIDNSCLCKLVFGHPRGYILQSLQKEGFMFAVSESGV